MATSRTGTPPFQYALCARKSCVGKGHKGGPGGAPSRSLSQPCPEVVWLLRRSSYWQHRDAAPPTRPARCSPPPWPPWGAPTVGLAATSSVLLPPPHPPSPPLSICRSSFPPTVPPPSWWPTPPPPPLPSVAPIAAHHAPPPPPRSRQPARTGSRRPSPPLPSPDALSTARRARRRAAGAAAAAAGRCRCATTSAGEAGVGGGLLPLCGRGWQRDAAGAAARGGKGRHSARQKCRDRGGGRCRQRRRGWRRRRRWRGGGVE